jgi:hypothetical protein
MQLPTDTVNCIPPSQFEGSNLIRCAIYEWSKGFCSCKISLAFISKSQQHWVVLTILIQGIAINLT